MKTTKTRTCCALLVAVLTIAAASSARAEDLGSLLRESGWDRMMGTWVDAETKGENVKVTYAWKIKDRVIESTSKIGPVEAVALAAVNAKTGEVHHAGADSRGGVSVGKWSVEDGKAVLRLTFVSGEGHEGEVTISHQLQDDDTLIVTVDLADSFSLTLIRAK